MILYLSSCVLPSLRCCSLSLFILLAFSIFFSCTCSILAKRNSLALTANIVVVFSFCKHFAMLSMNQFSLLYALVLLFFLLVYFIFSPNEFLLCILNCLLYFINFFLVIPNIICLSLCIWSLVSNVSWVHALSISNPHISWLWQQIMENLITKLRIWNPYFFQFNVKVYPEPEVLCVRPFICTCLLNSMNCTYSSNWACCLYNMTPFNLIMNITDMLNIFSFLCKIQFQSTVALPPGRWTMRKSQYAPTQQDFSFSPVVSLLHLFYSYSYYCISLDVLL